MQPINETSAPHRSRRIAAALIAAVCAVTGCSKPPPQYGAERQLMLPGLKSQVWAVAPVLNLSGEKSVDPILQADLLFHQLGEVHGIRAIPVNRTAEAYQGLHIEKVQSEQEAAIVCEMLGCDALVIATVTSYDPYNPPKMGLALQVFRRPAAIARAASASLSPREMTRMAALPATQPAQANGGLIQAVGMYDAQNGTVRSALLRFAQGRNDPDGPYASKEYFVNMDRFGEFAYHTLITEVLTSPQLWRGEGAASHPVEYDITPPPPAKSGRHAKSGN